VLNTLFTLGTIGGTQDVAELIGGPNNEVAAAAAHIYRRERDATETYAVDVAG